MFGKEKKEIKFRTIIELMGRPPEFLTETLNKVIETIEKDEKIKILRKEAFEPKETAEKNIFSNFMELELEVQNIEKLFEFIAEYLPSNVEITNPPELSFDLNAANAIIHNILSKMHSYDSIAKKVGFENLLLKKKFSEIMHMPIKIEENLEDKEEKKEEQEKGHEKSGRKKKK